MYSADADFSCFADLAITSPVDYYREGQGSLLQCVLTPADPYMPLSNEEIAAKVHSQVAAALPPLSCCLPGEGGVGAGVAVCAGALRSIASKVEGWSALSLPMAIFKGSSTMCGHLVAACAHALWNVFASQFPSSFHANSSCYCSCDSQTWGCAVGEEMV